MYIYIYIYICICPQQGRASLRALAVVAAGEAQQPLLNSYY